MTDLAARAAEWAVKFSESIRVEEAAPLSAFVDRVRGRGELQRMGDDLVAHGMPVLPPELVTYFKDESQERCTQMAFILDDILQRRLWARNRVTYAVDPDLWRELGSVDDTDVIHKDVFDYLPHPNPFVVFPEPIVIDGGGPEVQHVVGMLITGRTTIELGLIGEMRCSTDDPRSVGLSLLFYGPIYTREGQLLYQRGSGYAPDAMFTRIGLAFSTSTMTFQELLKVVISRYTTSYYDPWVRVDSQEQAEIMLRRALAVLVYICATNAEVDKAGPQAASAAVRSAKTAGVNPKPPRVFQVGYRVGAALRRARAADRERSNGHTGRTVAPHIRRAHFHTFRCGPGRTESRVKWLPPIPVNVNDADADVTTVIPVKE